MSEYKTDRIIDIVKVVLYLRLSDEDRDKLSHEEASESIKNQEIMLRNYADEQGWKIVAVYNDEDWSGADATRPHFNEMISLCEEGETDIVLVKSQSRFARDMELIEKYVHNLFHEWGVRFVSIVDRIDNTKKETKKTSQILGLTDEWYLEDTSNNIRETLKTKRKDGQFTGSFTPYGYMRDKENKNHLVPDPVVRDVIVRIFNEYVCGYGLEKIAKALTNDGILSPLEYKLANGSNIKLPIIKDTEDYDSINKTGTFIVRVSYKNKNKQILKDLTTIEILTDFRKLEFNNKLSLQISKVKNDKILFYYSTKSLEELNITIENKKLNYDHINFQDSDNWFQFSENEILPESVTCIATHIARLDRTNEIFYEYEITLKENREHNKYIYKVFPNSQSDDVILDYKVDIRSKHGWNTQTIKKFLKDEVYIGNLVQFKTTTVSYKNHTTIYNDKEDQIRVENTHEPLVDKELWCEVQERLNARKKACKNGSAHILANKVFCENCKKVFCKCGKNDEFGMAYLCCKDKHTKWSNCDNKKYIKEIIIQDYVLEEINKLLDNFYSEDKQLEINDNMVEKELFMSRINNLTKEKETILKETKIKETYFQTLYEDLKKSLINESEYVLLRKKYKEDCSRLKKRLNCIDYELQIIEKKQENLKDKKTLFKKYRHIDKLSIEVVNDFIDKIFISKFDEKTHTREIHIVWNFIV